MLDSRKAFTEQVHRRSIMVQGLLSMNVRKGTYKGSNPETSMLHRANLNRIVMTSIIRSVEIEWKHGRWIFRGIYSDSFYHRISRYMVKSQAIIS